MLDRGNTAHRSLLVGLKNKVIASLNKFTTTAFGHNVTCVGVPAALLTVMSTSINKGANVGFGKLGGRVNTFTPTTDMLVRARFLHALSTRGFFSKCTRVLGRKLVDDASR